MEMKSWQQQFGWNQQAGDGEKHGQILDAETQNIGISWIVNCALTQQRTAPHGEDSKN